jgi:antitoxin (DNA-binding transcriptional repressor) of toxin-antitoxin stability system
METISVSEFKAKCLRILEDISRQKKRMMITKRGVPIAELRSIEPLLDEKTPLRETVTFVGDIISPVAEEDWEAMK